MRFKGVLVRLDEPSNKPPNGSNGHRIIVSSKTATERLNTLIGMGLNYAPTLDGHAQKHKVGTIQKAWIEGKDLWVQGSIWKKDFPEAETDLKKPGLGMSMELSQVHVEDPDAEIWVLTDFYFTGATILKKDAAAYYQTQAIAARADNSRSVSMKKVTGKKPAAGVTQSVDVTQVVAMAASAAAEESNKKIAEMFAPITKILAQQQARIEELELGATPAVQAKHEEPDEDDMMEDGDEEVDDMTTKKVASQAEDEEAQAEDEEEEDEDDEEASAMGAGGVDKGSLTDMGPDTADPGDDEPGHFNEKAKNKGNKTASEDKVGSNVNDAVTGASLKVLRKQVKTLQSELAAAKTHNQRLEKKLNRYTGIALKASAETGRRSLSPELIGMLAKSNVNYTDLQASGSKMPVQDVDAIIAQFEQTAGVRLDVTKRMEIKNKFLEAGLMEQGEVNRGFSLFGR